ncbi:MAG TPA: molybdopterin converting factor subunit 1 [Dongiaceae bacterium]|jgi:molybdopterin synthase sulfur carrier subunit|nr:molybdopterin converting factor subunit 1 [Dongiaceae bacterium]
MKILYFSWVKQRIGHGVETVTLPPSVNRTGQLREWLLDRSPGHRAALADAEVLRVARNLTYCDWEEPIADGDEIAFFPPVTGG